MYLYTPYLIAVTIHYFFLVATLNSNKYESGLHLLNFGVVSMQAIQFNSFRVSLMTLVIWHNPATLANLMYKWHWCLEHDDITATKEDYKNMRLFLGKYCRFSNWLCSQLFDRQPIFCFTAIKLTEPVCQIYCYGRYCVRRSVSPQVPENPSGPLIDNSIVLPCVAFGVLVWSCCRAWTVETV